MPQITQSKLPYRAEIDGLRAIAVVSVIFYHAQIVLFGKHWFKGGYIGVDIFFVISGYLITRIILAELYDKNSFSFLNFYERRARRILPVLFAVILVSVPFAYFTMLPTEIVEYAQSILSAIFFGSNFFFYSITTEYGAESALLKPFLHTWSLGVEEQFYLVFPVLALIIFKHLRKYFLTILMALSALSLLFAEFMEIRNAELNFYLPFSRFWELSVGSVLAFKELASKHQSNNNWQQLLPKLGLFLIVYSVLIFDSKTPHPSFHTIIPILGVALIIGCASNRELVGQLLGSKIFVWIGLISYSAYLWHFPIFAFSRVRDSSLTNFDKLELLSLTILFSILSFWLIERPFRRRFTRRVFLSVISVLALIIIIPAAVVSINDHFSEVWERFAPQSLAVPYKVIKDTQTKRPLVVNECHINEIGKVDSADFGNTIQKCRQKFGRAVFLLGDSHAANLFNIFRYSEKFPFLIGSVRGGCRPHGCSGKTNLYDFFVSDMLPFAADEDVVVFHQSGSYLIKDDNGNNDSQRPFNSGDFTIDYENITKIKTYLSLVSSKTSAPVIWLGPFIEYRHDPKNIINFSRKGQSYETLMTINKNSFIVFRDLEKALRNLVVSDDYSYVPFSQLHTVERKALVGDLNGKSCFQFLNSDHFSTCGERLIGISGRFNFVGF